MNQNGLASASNGILTNVEINQDVAMRAELQNNLPLPTKVVRSPEDSESAVLMSINSLRPGQQKNSDTNRLYASGTNALSRRLFHESSPKSAFGPPSPIRNTAMKRPSSVVGSPRKLSPPKYRDRPFSAVDPCMLKHHPSDAADALKNTVDDSKVLDQLRPFRVAIIRRMQEKSTERVSLQRLHGILLGRDDDEGDNIKTIAFDSIGFDDNWTEEFKLNEIIDVMISFFKTKV